jgi:3-hydroxyisobutyrate dehydrogenase-like beta-hydroxyacid dehydrogenase
MRNEEESQMAQQTVGMIGLGIMGSAMSYNLGRAGVRVVGYDVAPRARAAHRRSGGAVARSPREVASRADIIISSLPSARALAEVSADLAKSSKRGTVIVETSTLPIGVKTAAREALAKRGVTLLDCPLSGTGAQARAKDLLIYVSGERAAYNKIAPVLPGFTSAAYYVGPFGAGSKMKFVANLLVAIHNVAAAEAMVLGMKAGLDPALILKVVAGGAGGSRMFQVRGPMMVKGDYSQATMKNEVWQKDMTIIGDFARSLDCPTPLFAASAPIYNAAMAMGLGKEDTGAVCKVLEEMAGRPRRRANRRR